MVASTEARLDGASFNTARFLFSSSQQSGNALSIVNGECGGAGAANQTFVVGPDGELLPGFDKSKCFGVSGGIVELAACGIINPANRVVWQAWA